MQPAVKLTIPGEPVAQGRHRFSRRGKYISKEGSDHDENA